MAPPNNRTASCPSNSRGNIYVCMYIYIYIYRERERERERESIWLMYARGSSLVAQCSPYSCRGSPMDRGAWRATVHGVAKVRHS